MEKVLVLMSTYNGEKYLPEQLDSIFSQTGVELLLLIRDDGSSDTTPSIIENYKSKYPDRISLIKGSNIGWRKSFFTLAQLAKKDYTDFKYFAFADQDDIWLPQKLERGIETLQKLPDGPKLYCSNVTQYKDGITLGNLRKESVKPSVKGCLIRNYATGCTMVFNRSLLDLVSKELPKITIAHDYWFYMVACLCGYAVIDDESFIRYRIHNNNQVGFKSGFFENWQRRLRSVSNLLNNHEKEVTAAELLRIHGHAMKSEARNAVYNLARYKSSLSSRLSLLLDNGYTYNSRSNDLWLKLRILSGKL